MTETLKLPRKVNASAIDALLNDVKARPLGDIVLDGSDVEQLGGLGLQALLVMAAECDSEGFRLTVENMSPTARETFTLLGVDPETIAKGDVQ